MYRRLWVWAGFAVAFPTYAHAQSPASCVVSGTMAAYHVPLPGVVLSVVDAEGSEVVDVTSSNPDGTFTLRLPVGRYRLRTELTGFASLTRDVTIGDDCQIPLALTMELASRKPRRRAGEDHSEPTTADPAGPAQRE